MFETVVVGADGSETAAEAVRQAVELVKLTGGGLHIVSAYTPHALKTGGGEFARSLGSDSVARSLLDDLGSRAAVAGVQVDTHAIAGSPADAICQVAGDVNADLIVVGNKGMSGARRILGSVPNSVAHQAPCSVLLADTV